MGWWGWVEVYFGRVGVGSIFYEWVAGGIFWMGEGG